MRPSSLRNSQLNRSENEGVREEDIHMHICDEMSRGRPVDMSPTSSNGCEVIEYHGGESSVTILGEALAQQQHNRLVKVVLMSERLGSNHGTAKGLDAIDMEYLRSKGALDVPPRECW